MQKKFIAGQLYELSQLLGELYSLEPLDLRSYIKDRIKVLEDDLDTVPPSVRRSSRGEDSKESLKSVQNK